MTARGKTPLHERNKMISGFEILKKKRKKKKEKEYGNKTTTDK